MRKLKLDKETIRLLTDADLRRALGGAGPLSGDEQGICPPGTTLCAATHTCYTKTCSSLCGPP